MTLVGYSLCLCTGAATAVEMALTGAKGNKFYMFQGNWWFNWRGGRNFRGIERFKFKLMGEEFFWGCCDLFFVVIVCPFPQAMGFSEFCLSLGGRQVCVPKVWSNWPLDRIAEFASVVVMPQRESFFTFACGSFYNLEWVCCTGMPVGRLSQDKTIRGYFESKIGVGCGYVPFAITAAIKNFVAYF